MSFEMELEEYEEDLLIKSSRKRCLVTGGAGFVGTNLVNRLIKDNYEVVVFDNLSTGKEENINQKAKFFKLDISDNDVFDKKRITPPAYRLFGYQSSEDILQSIQGL